MDMRGDNVWLRPLTRADVDVMAKWQKFSEPDLQWANFEPRSEAEKDMWFASGRDDHTRRRFAIVTIDSRVIGTLGIRNISRALGQATLGIRIGAGDVGKGFGTEAINLLLRFAFSDMNLQRVNLDVADVNKRARRCYEKLGFRRIGQHIGLDGNVYIDMEINRREFLAKNAHTANVYSALRERGNQDGVR